MVEKDLSKRFYLKSREKYASYVNRKYFSDRELEVQVVEEGIVLPARLNKGEYQGGVCDKDLNFVAGYTRYDSHTHKGDLNHWAAVVSAYKVDRRGITYFDEDVIFGGALMGHFGHFMVECWTRLWYVLSPPPR